jgi:hypothetical protein
MCILDDMKQREDSMLASPPGIQVRHCDLFQFRTTSEIMNQFDMVGHLEQGSARCSASSYTGQHITERRGQTSVPQAGFERAVSASK